MKLNLKLTALAAFAAITTAQAQTADVLQSVNVAFTLFTQGTPVATASGSNNVVVRTRFTSKNLIQAVSASGTYFNGDVLVRSTYQTNVPISVTNLVPYATNTLTFTNTSTNALSPTNELILNSNTPITIGDTNVTFGTNIETIGGSSVTSGTNTAIAGTNSVIVGTNTTVTSTVITNGTGQTVGTNYVFISNTFTNTTGTRTGNVSAWEIYNRGNLTPISTNVLFDIRTAHVHGDTNLLALIHGESIGKNDVIRSGTTDEIRLFVLSNATWNIKMAGYAQGHYVNISLGQGATTNSQDLNWTGSGSGTVNSNTPLVVDGTIAEHYFKLLK